MSCLNDNRRERPHGDRLITATSRNPYCAGVVAAADADKLSPGKPHLRESLVNRADFRMDSPGTGRSSGIIANEEVLMKRILLRSIAMLLGRGLPRGRYAVAAGLDPAAADRDPVAAGLDLPRPRLVVQGAEIPIRLESVAITTSIAGRLAQTSVELVFFNPNARQLEGELQFPLLDGQEITGFAMDFDGKLREAVPVEKSRGQAVFEDITRVRVDPALAEKTVGNNFKLRVYPLFAHMKKS
jgi:hypothetical protein